MEEKHGVKLGTERFISNRDPLLKGKQQAVSSVFEWWVGHVLFITYLGGSSHDL